MRGEGGGWGWEGVTTVSGPVAKPGVMGGENASERSHGERASVDETLDNRLNMYKQTNSIPRTTQDNHNVHVHTKVVKVTDC